MSPMRGTVESNAHDTRISTAWTRPRAAVIMPAWRTERPPSKGVAPGAASARGGTEGGLSTPGSTSLTGAAARREGRHRVGDRRIHVCDARLTKLAAHQIPDLAQVARQDQPAAPNVQILTQLGDHPDR